MSGKSRGESRYNSPEAINDLKERLRVSNVPGINPLQPAFVIAVIDEGGWYEISPQSQVRLDKYLTEEKSQAQLGIEYGVKQAAICLSNMRALEALHAYFVSVCPERANEFPLDAVKKRKDLIVTGSLGGRFGRLGGRPKEPNSRRSRAERRKLEKEALNVS